MCIRPSFRANGILIEGYLLVIPAWGARPQGYVGRLEQWIQPMQKGVDRKAQAEREKKEREEEEMWRWENIRKQPHPLG